MNYYPFHIGDYAAATRHLSWDEDLAYRRLLDAYYVRESRIPLDRRQVYRLVSAATPEQRQAVDDVLAEFFSETPDGWMHTRCEAVIAFASEKRAKASASARNRWQKSEGSPDGMRSDSESDANASGDNANASENGCEGNAPNTNTKTKRSTKNKSPAGAGVVWPEGVEDQVRDDWLKVRKAKRAPLTQTALDGVIREAGKAGISLNAALKICVRRNWVGFDAGWVAGAGGSGNGGSGGKFDPVGYVNSGRNDGQDDTGTGWIDGESSRMD